MSLIPLEILHKIASYNVESYRALLAIPAFARSVGREYPVYGHYEKIVDYMIRFGYRVKISESEISWYLNGRLHRIDGPAVVTVTGTKIWYQHGVKHRSFGGIDMYFPTVKYSNGNREWWYRGQRHRDGSPAIINADGHKEWYLYGELHSQDDRPAIKRTSGDKEWYCHGRRHRSGNKPAMVFADGTKAYYYDGKKFDPTERRRDY
jgi:hypothetical protein